MCINVPSRQQKGKNAYLSLERRLSYKGSPGRIAGSDQKAGAEKGKVARIALNWPQAVLRLEYVEDGQENVTMEEANEGEKE